MRITSHGSCLWHWGEATVWCLFQQLWTGWGPSLSSAVWFCGLWKPFVAKVTWHLQWWSIWTVPESLLWGLGTWRCFLWQIHYVDYLFWLWIRIPYEQAADDIGGLFIVQHLVVIFFAVVRGKGVSFDFNEFSVDIQSFKKKRKKRSAVCISSRLVGRVLWERT